MPNKFVFTIASLVLSTVRLGLAADATDWPSWRGPLTSGSVERGNYPVEFGGYNYLWRTSLPGKGCSTPILLKRVIYLTSPADGKDGRSAATT